jgi:FkbM family methyltransferase
MGSFKAQIVRWLPPKLAQHLRATDHYLHGEPELRLLRQLVDSRRSAVDAGANIGTYAYFLHKYASRVLAYEPNPGLAARLKSLMPTVVVRQVALSDSARALTLAVPLDAQGLAQHELGSVAQAFDGQVQRFEVECIALDSEEIEDVGFIKIDVEQHERQVLRGAMATIRRCRPVILAEVYPLKYTAPLSEEFGFLLEAGYCAWFSFDGEWKPLASFRPALHALAQNFGVPGKFMGNNMLFFPSEHAMAGTGPYKP